MKKTYSNPNMKVIKIATQQMLAFSDPTTHAKFDSNAGPVTDKSGMDARGGWFDEGEE
jgi:hypothetical protein